MKKLKVKLGDKDKEIFHVDEQEKEVLNQVDEIWNKGCYEAGRKKKDAIYLDLGANIGISVLYFLPYAKMIYAIEPNPYIFECLKKNVGKYKNVKLFNCGISQMEHTQYLYSSKSKELAQGIDAKDNTIYTIPAEMVPLDEFMKENEIEHVDVMKIDVENAEYHILPSESFGRASQKIDFIVGEAHYQDNGGFPEIVPLILKEWGYKTRWWKPKDPNYKNYIHYSICTDVPTGKKRTYGVGFNTIFEAEK